jgi:hypothetical protein
MAESVPYKLYKPNSGTGYVDFMPDLKATNSGYTATQYSEVTPQDFLANYYSKDQAYYDDYFARNTTPGVKEAFQQVISGGANNAPIQSGYVMDNGTLTTQSAINQQQANIAGVQSGALREISAGMYVPTGSAGDMLQQGLASGQVSATNPGQQYQASMQGNNTSAPGIKPVDPNQQVAQTPPVPTTPVSINPSTNASSNLLTNAPKTNLDIQSLLAQNMKIREQYLQSMMPSGAQLGLQQQLGQIKDQSRATQLSAQAGINQQSNRYAPMQAIVGAQRQIMEQANLQLQTLAAQADSITGQIQIEQVKSRALQDMLRAQLEFGQQDMELAQQYADQVKAEQTQAKKLALEFGVTEQFYDIGGTIYRTSDGKAY